MTLWRGNKFSEIIYDAEIIRSKISGNVFSKFHSGAIILAQRVIIIKYLQVFVVRK